MGQYFVFVNQTKREYVEPIDAKLAEIILNWYDGGVLAYLLADGSTDGTIFKDTPMFGHWSGDRIVVAGDYGQSGLYSEARAGYRDITLEVYDEMLTQLRDARTFPEKVYQYLMKELKRHELDMQERSQTVVRNLNTPHAKEEYIYTYVDDKPLYEQMAELNMCNRETGTDCYFCNKNGRLAICYKK